MNRQICNRLDVSGHGHRIRGMAIVGALLSPERRREKPEGWIIVEASGRADRDALSLLLGKQVRVRTGLTNGMARLSWVTHTRDADLYGGTSRLCLVGRSVPALVTVGEVA